MIENCARMAKAAEAAYLDGPEAKPVYKQMGYTTHKFIDIDGAQCHIVSNKEEIVICFRGTEPDELSDVLADLNAWPDKAYNGHGLVHNGFQEEVNKVWPKIETSLKMMKAKDKKLFICGHSLGGAMATIATSRLDNVDALYTYGSPRVGTRKWVNSIKTPHFRHVNNNDIVTKVPLAIMGYKHHGTLRYINFYGKIRKLTFWQAVKDKFRGYRSGLLDGAMDHGMANYVKALESIENDGNN